MPTLAAATVEDTAAVLATIHTESGASLLALTEASPVLLVFLRHFGCPFGRKTIGDVAELRPKLEGMGVRPVFVHLGAPELAKHYFDFYGISDVERVSDPEAQVYRSPVFGLGQRDPFLDLLNPKVWLGWFRKGTLIKQGMGKFEGDGTQMPGIFFVKGSKVVRQFRYKSIADEPDYLGLVA